MLDELRIVLAGDEGCGKTSIVFSLIAGYFDENVPGVLDEVTIPADVTDEKVSTRVVDTAASDEEALSRALNSAHVVCIVYSADDPESFSRTYTHWIPEIRKIRFGKPLIPVILVGNKVDMKGENIDSDDVESMMLPITRDFEEVSSFIECSAKRNILLDEVFYHAIKSVLWPNASLFDAAEQELSPRCNDALRRIFFICDTDGDGFLDAKELNQFQQRCFGETLTDGQLESLHELIDHHKGKEGYDDSMGISLHGFMFLQYWFIQKGRIDSVWQVLRSFGYDRDVVLGEEYLLPFRHSSAVASASRSVCLSDEAYGFLETLFDRMDASSRGAIDREEAACALKSFVPKYVSSPAAKESVIRCPGLSLGPFDPMQRIYAMNPQTNDKGSLTKDGWLAAWHALASEDHNTTVRDMAYLGYPQNTSNALSITSKRVMDLDSAAPVKKRHQRVWKRSCVAADGADPSSTQQESAVIGPSSFHEFLVGTRRDGAGKAAADGGGAECSSTIKALRDANKRSFHTVGVFGSSGCGKSCIIQAVSRGALSDGAPASLGQQQGAAMVAPNTYLHLKEMSAQHADALGTLKGDELIASMDFAIMVYDTTNATSFQECLSMQQHFDEWSARNGGRVLPITYIATKTDQTPVAQRIACGIETPEYVCEALEIPPPIHVCFSAGERTTAVEDVSSYLRLKLACVARRPQLFVPKRLATLSGWSGTLKLGVAIAALAAVSAGLAAMYRYWGAKPSDSTSHAGAVAGGVE